MRAVAEIQGPIPVEAFRARIEASYQPVVIRDQMQDWPIVQKARQSSAALADLLEAMDNGRELAVMIGPREEKGRFFYNEGITGHNFQVRKGQLTGFLRHLIRVSDNADADSAYVGGVLAGDYLRQWNETHQPPIDVPHAQPRLWIGNRTHVTTHMDETSNVAAVVAGRRKFVLFPPEQLDNLYLGPLHFTIAGPPVSMVDLNDPDLEKYPRFAAALEHAQVAELGPGDVIYIPAIWWHSITALESVNVMVNYWWAPEGARSGMRALFQTIAALRDLDPPHRAAWKHWFDRFVFDEEADRMADHLPDHVRGIAGPPSARRQEFLNTFFGNTGDF